MGRTTHKTTKPSKPKILQRDGMVIRSRRGGFRPRFVRGLGRIRSKEDQFGSFLSSIT